MAAAAGLLEKTIGGDVLGIPPPCGRFDLSAFYNPEAFISNIARRADEILRDPKPNVPFTPHLLLIINAYAGRGQLPIPGCERVLWKNLRGF